MSFMTWKLKRIWNKLPTIGIVHMLAFIVLGGIFASIAFSPDTTVKTNEIEDINNSMTDVMLVNEIIDTSASLIAMTIMAFIICTTLRIVISSLDRY